MIRFLVLIAAVAASAASACPDPSPKAPDPALIGTLTSWIATHTRYDTTRSRDDPPEILTCATGETIRYEGRDTLVEPGLMAAYGRPARRIFLVMPWLPDEPRDQARLLHELIHDVQFLNASWPCPQAAETEAYRLTAQWLEEQGLAPGFNWLQVFLASRCPTDIHP